MYYKKIQQHGNHSPSPYQPAKPTFVEINNIFPEATSVDSLISFLQAKATRPIKVSKVEYWNPGVGKAKLLLATKSMALNLVEMGPKLIFNNRQLSIHILSGEQSTSNSIFDFTEPSMVDASRTELSTILKAWLSSRFDSSSGYLNLSGIQHDRELANAVGQLPINVRPISTNISIDTPYWFNLIFSQICQTFTSVLSLNLSDNDIKSLDIFTSHLQSLDGESKSKKYHRKVKDKDSLLYSKFPLLFLNLQSLSFAKNQLTSLDEVIAILSALFSEPNCRLVELHIYDNPFISSLRRFPPTPIVIIYCSLATKFPSLKILDSLTLDLIRDILVKKSPPPSHFDPGLRDTLSAFLHSLVAGFDSSERSSLNVFYSSHPESRVSFYPLCFSESLLSSIFTNIPELFSLGSIWSIIQHAFTTLLQSKELFLLGVGESGKPEPISLQKSPSNIQNFLLTLPQLKHSLESLSVFAFNGRPLFTPDGELPIIQIFISGFFYEGAEMIQRAFVRNLIIIPNHTIADSPFSFSILFDDWYLCQLVQVQVTDPPELLHLPLMKRAIVKEFSKTVKLTTPYALQCLEQNGWRVLDAQEAVRILKVLYL